MPAADQAPAIPELRHPFAKPRAGTLPAGPSASSAARQGRPATRSQRVSHRGLFLTREEMAAIAKATSTDRDQLLVRALAETGARLGEMLKLSSARLGQGYVVLPIEKRRQYEEKAVYLSRTPSCCTS